ncbi:MAG: hypothetical protein HC861_04425 [Rhodospirillaceae bacterium]|nr:hypothetical protein [Rhodospirillaceae bacterium]
MRVVWAASIALASCASTPMMEAFSLDALVADAPAYVAYRYASAPMPVSLIDDLTDIDFQCQHSATGSECGRARQEFGNCFDIVTVHIRADEPVRADSTRRCPRR